ncbi:DUF2892 domain-containing protein [Prolixibacteraceae bacterium JC049]|nr:DUF2892 domain-containing protein [Prolixibacteraceae bacterium JC049]
MACNVTTKSRTIRIVIGLIIIAVGFYFNSWWGAIGLFPFIVGLTGFCPLGLLSDNGKTKETTKS